MIVKDVFLLLLVALIWGCNFVIIKIGLDEFPPILFTALRFICAAFPMILLVPRKGIEWKWIISVGLIFGVGLFGLLFVGMSVGMPAGLSSLVLQIQLVFTLLLSSTVLREPSTPWQRGGGLVAFLGILLLVVEKYHATSLAGLLLVVLAGFAWGVTNVLIRISQQKDIFRFVVWISIVPPIPLCILSFFFEENQLSSLQNISWTGVGAVLYTALIATVFAFWLWAKMIRKYSANSVAPFSLLVPLFGIFSSVVILGEKLTVNEIMASILVFGGLFLIMFGERILERIIWK